MLNSIQRLALRLVWTVIRTIWSLLLPAITMDLGYFLGQRWGQTEGEPNGVWFGGDDGGSDGDGGGDE